MARFRKKRLDRLPNVRSSMQDILVRSAEMLPKVGDEEKIVIGVNFFRKSAEDNTGIPSQIIMQAVKRELLEKNKSAIQVREF